MVKLYLKMFSLKVREELEYRASFITNAIGQIFTFFTYYFTILIMFNKFSNIAGFSLYEVLLTFGIIFFGYSFNEVFIRGIDKFEDLITTGDLDRLLVRPQGVLFQACVSQVDFVKIMRLLQSIIVIVIAVIRIDVIWNIPKIITLILMVISSCTLFFGLFVLMASYCFITVQGLEVKNLVLDGGKYLAQYPISIYPKSVMKFLTFVIPYGIVNYYPLLYLIGKNNSLLCMLSPLFGFIFLIPCIMAFQLGLRKYSSTGS